MTAGPPLEPTDAELVELAGRDPGLLDTAGRLRDSLHSAAAVDPDFRRRLQSRLVADRREMIAARRSRWFPSLQGWRDWRPRRLEAFGVSGVAIAVAAAVIFYQQQGTGGPSPVVVAMVADVSGNGAVDPGHRLSLEFQNPMNHAAVEAALRVQPATTLDRQWQGNTLMLTAPNGLIPDAPYALTVDHAVARTAAGASLAHDISVWFGTAPSPLTAPSSSPVTLASRVVTAAGAGSEAVIAADGSLIATDAGASGSGTGGVVRITGSGVSRLAASTSAICVSQSGRSLAYLTSAPGGHSSIVFAAGNGLGGHAVPAAVDSGSPLGWIGDTEVSFVSQGYLSAVDATGHTRTLSDQAINSASDTVVVSPGGRYVYFQTAGAAAAGSGVGRVIDILRRTTHDLPGVLGQPAFSADGATILWMGGAGTQPLLSAAPSAGGPVQTIALPIARSDTVSDLSLSPGGDRLAYSVKHGGGGTEFRLAGFPSGATIATVPASIGESPNWAPNGGEVAILRHTGAGQFISVVAVDSRELGSPDPAAAVRLFADALVGGDQGAQQFLSATSLKAGALAAPTRVNLRQFQGPDAHGRYIARATLLYDGSERTQAVRVIDATLTLGPDAGGRLLVEAFTTSDLHDLSAGPHIRSIAPAAGTGGNGAFAITYDSDCDPASVTDALSVTSGGETLAHTTRYDTAGRTAVVTLSRPAGGAVDVTIGNSLKDIDGHHLGQPFRTSVTLGSA